MNLRIVFSLVIVCHWMLSVDSQTSDIDFSNLNSVTLAQLDPKIFHNITADQLRRIPQSALKGMSANQSSQISPEACKGFLSYQIVNLSIEAFTSLSPLCFSEIPNFNQTGPEFFLSLPIEYFAQFTSANFPTIRTEVVQHLSSDHISRLSPRKNGSCSGITAEQMNALPPNAYHGFTRSCVQLMSPSAWSGAKLDGIQRLTGVDLDQNRGACHGISPEMLKNIDSRACEGFMPNCIMASSLSWASAASSISTCISSIYPSHFSYFTKESINDLPPILFKYLTADQIGFILPSACGGLRGVQVQMIEPEYFSRISALCFSRFSSEAVSKMSHWQLEKSKPASIAGFGDNFGSISLEALWGLSLAHLKYLSPESVHSLSADHLRELFQVTHLGAEILGPNGFNQNQLERPNITTVAKSKQLVAAGRLTPFLQPPNSIEAASALSWLHVTLTMDNIFEKLDPKNATLSLIPSAVAGIRASQARLLTIDAISGINFEQASYLQEDAVSGLDDDHFEALSADAIAGLSLNGWAGAESCKTCIAALSAEKFTSRVDWNNVTCRIISFLSMSQTVLIGFERLKQLQKRQSECAQPVFDYIPWNPIQPHQVMLIIASLVFAVFMLASAALVTVVKKEHFRIPVDLPIRKPELYQTLLKNDNL